MPIILIAIAVAITSVVAWFLMSTPTPPLTQQPANNPAPIEQPLDTGAQLPPPGEPIQNTPQTPATPTPTSPDTKPTSLYKDGTYTVVGTYRSPAGTDPLGVTLTLTNDMVTSASVEVKTEHEKSMQYQRAFASGFSNEVVGKKIDSIALTVVNGSSLTPKGFMDALAQVKTQARN